jgi:geranyl diphosphate synthase
LSQAAGYFFRQGVQGKRLRPTLVMLMASALASEPPSANWHSADLRPASQHVPELRRRQQRVAEVAEMMHVASLLHDDVIDDATQRRGVLSVNAKSGNKLAILAGDFLLARASVTLASLQNTLIVELMSNVLENLVCGEVMQVRSFSVVIGWAGHTGNTSQLRHHAALPRGSCLPFADVLPTFNF